MKKKLDKSYPTIENWFYSDADCNEVDPKEVDSYCIAGYLTNSPFMPGGSEIRTSTVIFEGDGIVKTLNSTYLLGKRAMASLLFPIRGAF